MCHSDRPDTGAGDSASRDEGIVSLCERRRRRDLEDSTQRLIERMEALHCEAISVHNQIIDRAELSVLTELCRTTGLVLDRIDDDLQASVVIPAALYGDSGDDVFGKKPLQRRLANQIDDEESKALLRQLCATNCAVWQLLSDDAGLQRSVVPLAGPGRDETQEVAAIICREGRCSEIPGVYCGWELTFEGHRFIVFAHRLERTREVAVRDLVTAREDRDLRDFWRRVHLSLIRSIIDPEGRHPRPLPEASRHAIRRPASRRGLVLAIRRAIWRHFADPREGLTIHAHIAALVGDDEAYRAFIDELLEIADAITIKFGGLPTGEDPIDVDELLTPFYACKEGQLRPPQNLERHPLAILLLEEPILDALQLHPHQSIESGIRRCAEESRCTSSRALELAWMTYRTEQNLVATYGVRLAMSCRPSIGAEQALPCARQSPVLPNLRVLFDPRFLDYTLADLDLSQPDRARLERALSREDSTIDTFQLAGLDRDERQLTRLHGVSHHTCNAVRRALLELAAHWRWRRCGLDIRSACRRQTATPTGPTKGLDLPKEFFDN